MTGRSAQCTVHGAQVPRDDLSTLHCALCTAAERPS
jgi:hypothetical protein